MSAETLRRAAREMRADYPEREWDRDEHAFAFHHAVADWLYLAADHAALGGGCGSCRTQALAVARAYLGGDL